MSRAILLVDHGSRRPEANAILEELARRLRARVPERVVEFAHMELVPPSIADALDACVRAGAESVVVHPYFLGPGSHSARDIPQRVQEAAARHPGVRVRVSEPLGIDDRLVDVVLARVAAAEEE